MRRYLLDTNAVSDLINDRRGVRARADVAKRAGGRLGTCHPVVGEFYYGIEQSASRDANFKIARAGLSRLRIWPFDMAAAEEYGRLYAELIRRGRLMQQSTSNRRRRPHPRQLHRRHLRLRPAAVPGLAVENWAA
jgi:predicted nucleic acid-binding protein